MADSWKDGILLKIINIIGYFAFIGSNLLAIFFLCWFRKDTYIMPARWAFYIWYLIHTLLLGPVIYVVLWGDQYYATTFVFSFFVNSAVTHIYYIVKKYHSPASYADELFIHLPISLYHAWTTVLVVVTAFDAFGVDRHYNAAGIWTEVFVFLALFFLEFAAATYAFLGDLPASIAIAWSLWAIFDGQTYPGFVHWSALAFSALAIVWVARGVFGLYGRTRGGKIALGDEERAPFVGYSETKIYYAQL